MQFSAVIPNETVLYREKTGVYAPCLQNCLKRVEKPGSCFHFDLFPFVICTCQQKLDTKIKKLDVEKYLAYNSNESLYKRSATP